MQKARSYEDPIFQTPKRHSFRQGRNKYMDPYMPMQKTPSQKPAVFKKQSLDLGCPLSRSQPCDCTASSLLGSRMARVYIYKRRYRNRRLGCMIYYVEFDVAESWTRTRRNRQSVSPVCALRPGFCRLFLDPSAARCTVQGSSALVVEARSLAAYIALVGVFC